MGNPERIPFPLSRNPRATHPPSRPIPRRRPTSLAQTAGLLLGAALLVAACSPGPATAAAPNATAPAPGPLPSYAQWRDACRSLPSNRDLLTGKTRQPGRALAGYADFAAALEPFLSLCATGDLAQASRWLDRPPGTDTFLNLDATYLEGAGIPFEPYAQRHDVPPGTRVQVQGDLHGDIHTLLAFLDVLQDRGDLDGFRITQPDVRLVFLGDYTDRGRYGVEVLYTLLRLKVANPAQVLLVRGNHEDFLLVARYGFLAEITAKYGRQFDVRRLLRLYDFLPSVLYLTSGTNGIQCNHGGLEPGYDPKRLLAAPPATAYQLLGRLHQRSLLQDNPDWMARQPPSVRRELEASLADFVPASPTTPSPLGFLWNDFTVALGEPQFAVDPGRALVYGDEATRWTLDRASDTTHRLHAIFRAHQHAAEPNPLMRRLMASGGVFRHWQTADPPRLRDAASDVLERTLETSPERPIPEGSVWTFNVSPDSVYGLGCGFSFATFGELRTAERWEDWRLRVHQFTPALPK